MRELEAERTATVVNLKRTATDPWVRVALPSNSQAIEPLPVERRETFEAHLRAIVAKADDSSESTAEASGQLPTAGGKGKNPANRLLGRACGVCRGWCCHKAGDKNAYLTTESIQVYRLWNPGVPSDEVIAAYLSRIPEESYEGSCVFHGRHGCRLPRKMRSETCNWFLCAALIELSRRVALEDRAMVFAAAMRDAQPDRVVVFDADSVHYEQFRLSPQRPQRAR